MAQTPAITIGQLDKLSPCSTDGKRVRAALRAVDSTPGRAFSAADARAAGCTFEDIVWVASAVALNDKAVKRRLRRWMADCAARVLHIYERDYPTDTRVRDAIQAARDFTDGKIDYAARDAARDAAWAAARAAAWAAARDAAWAAARDAARDAAWDAARDAAWDAARDAARDAAWDAAWDAARDAAWDAAWAAEEAWQFDRLVAWLSDPEPAPLLLETTKAGLGYAKAWGL